MDYLISIFRPLIGVSGLALLAWGAWLAYLDKAASAGIVFVFSMSCFLFTFVPLLAHLRAGATGIEAKFRRKFDELEDVLSKLRALMKPLSEQVYTLEGRSTYIFRPPVRQVHLRIEKDLDAALLDIGMSDSELRELKDYMLSCRRLDLFWMIYSKVEPIYKEHRSNLSQIHVMAKHEHGDNSSQARETLENVHAIDRELGDLRKLPNDDATSDDIASVIRNSEVLDQTRVDICLSACAEELRDLAYFDEHKELRRPDVWANFQRE